MMQDRSALCDPTSIVSVLLTGISVNLCVGSSNLDSDAHGHPNDNDSNSSSVSLTSDSCLPFLDFEVYNSKARTEETLSVGSSTQRTSKKSFDYALSPLSSESLDSSIWAEIPYENDETLPLMKPLRLFQTYSEKDVGRQSSVVEIDNWETEQRSPAFRKLSLQPECLSRGPVDVPISSLENIHMSDPSQQILQQLPDILRGPCDQKNSKVIQNLLESESQQTRNYVFRCVVQNSLNLSTDRFGNYILQRIFENGTYDQKQRLLNLLQLNFYALSENGFGCRVIQKAIETTRDDFDKQSLVMNELSPFVLLLIESQHGNHVIQKCCEVFYSGVMAPVVGVMVANLPRLAFHAYGCRVIQKYLQRKELALLEYQIIIQLLLDRTRQLSQCQYGNYVMQYLVSNNDYALSVIREVFQDHWLELSCNKYASNVMEKIIKCRRAGGDSFCARMVKQLISAQRYSLLALSTHQFGNFVVQRLIEYVKPIDLQIGLKRRLREMSGEIGRSKYGTYVLQIIEKGRY